MEGTLAAGSAPLYQFRGASFLKSLPQPDIRQACTNQTLTVPFLSRDSHSNSTSQRTVCRSQLSQCIPNSELRTLNHRTEGVIFSQNHAALPSRCQKTRTRAASEAASASVSTDNGRPISTAALQGLAEPYFPNNEANIKVIGKATWLVALGRRIAFAYG